MSDGHCLITRRRAYIRSDGRLAWRYVSDEDDLVNLPVRNIHSGCPIAIILKLESGLCKPAIMGSVMQPCSLSHDHLWIDFDVLFTVTGEIVRLSIPRHRTSLDAISTFALQIRNFCTNIRRGQPPTSPGTLALGGRHRYHQAVTATSNNPTPVSDTHSWVTPSEFLSGKGVENKAGPSSAVEDNSDLSSTMEGSLGSSLLTVEDNEVLSLSAKGKGKGKGKEM